MNQVFPPSPPVEAQASKNAQLKPGTPRCPICLTCKMQPASCARHVAAVRWFGWAMLLGGVCLTIYGGAQVVQSVERLGGLSDGLSRPDNPALRTLGAIIIGSGLGSVLAGMLLVEEDPVLACDHCGHVVRVWR